LRQLLAATSFYSLIKIALFDGLYFHAFMRLFFFYFLSVFVLISCSKKKINTNEEYFLKAVPLGELKNKNLEESSGLVASINNPGYLWTHNDSGNKAEVFLIDEHAKVKLTCTLKGIKNRDWEDITIGPGPEPEKNYIYVGDIGDNFARHPFKYIYRFEEPRLEEGVDEIEITAVDKITFRLSDEQKDSEALMLDPKTKDLFVVSKREEPVYLYQLKYPYSTTDTITASRLFSLPLTQIVAGDFSADGEELLLKNYEEIYYWQTPKDKLLEEALKQKATKVAYEQEPQGEAIAWSRDKSGFYTLTEKVKGEKCILFFHKRNEH
jgi:hypothetical protein